MRPERPLFQGTPVSTPVVTVLSGEIPAPELPQPRLTHTVALSYDLKKKGNLFYNFS